MATTKTTVSDNKSVDYYENMPDWQKEQLVGNAAHETAMRDATTKIAADAGKNPRKIAGLDPRETQALKTQTGATDKLVSGTDKNIKDVAGINVAKDLGKIAGPKDMGKVYQVGDFKTTAAPSSDFTRIDAPKAADVNKLRAGYESGYTDDVVNTTLAGMTREQQRAQLARDSKNAAIGGTSNSRSAVADAVAGNLSQMSMAQTEAGLRDKAFNTAAGYGLQEADMQNKFGLDTAKFSKDQEDSARKYGLDLSQFGLEQEKARSDYELGRAGQSLDEQKARAASSLANAGFTLEEAQAQAAQGNTAAKLALEKAGLTDDLMKTGYGASTDLAGAQAGIGKTQREIDQQQIDSNYYGKMEAATWAADLYNKTNTNNPAPYSYSSTGTSTTKAKTKDPSKLQQIAGAVTSGVAQFLD